MPVPGRCQFGHINPLWPRRHVRCRGSATNTNKSLLDVQSLLTLHKGLHWFTSSPKHNKNHQDQQRTPTSQRLPWTDNQFKMADDCSNINYGYVDPNYPRPDTEDSACIIIYGYVQSPLFGRHVSLTKVEDMSPVSPSACLVLSFSPLPSSLTLTFSSGIVPGTSAPSWSVL